MRSLNLILLVLCLQLGSTVQAQERNYYTLVAGGINTPLLDGGIGPYIGIHPHYHFASHFAVEAQLSYKYSYIFSTFINGDKSDMHSANALVGFRFYFMKPENKTRLYVNALAGFNYTEEKNSMGTYNDYRGLGLSSGLWVELKNRIPIGLTFDTQGHWVLKAGWNF